MPQLEESATKHGANPADETPQTFVVRALAVENVQEFSWRVVFDRILARICSGALGPGADGLSAMRVTLHESHIAAASYEGDLPT